MYTPRHKWGRCKKKTVGPHRTLGILLYIMYIAVSKDMYTESVLQMADVEKTVGPHRTLGLRF